jgi:hypothetical protein
MTELITARGLITEISDQFDRRGWRDVGNLALKIAQQAQRDTRLDAREAAGLANSTFLSRNQITSSELEAALRALFENRELENPSNRVSQSNVTGDKRIEIGRGATLNNVTFNVGDQQINSSATSSKAEVEAEIALLLRRVLSGQGAIEELLGLNQVAQQRGDLSAKEVEVIAAEVIDDAEPEPSRLVQLRDRMIESAVTGVVVQGVLGAIGLG